MPKPPRRRHQRTEARQRRAFLRWAHDRLREAREAFLAVVVPVLAAHDCGPDAPHFPEALQLARYVWNMATLDADRARAAVAHAHQLVTDRRRLPPALVDALLEARTARLADHPWRIANLEVRQDGDDWAVSVVPLGLPLVERVAGDKGASDLFQLDLRGLYALEQRLLTLTGRDAAGRPLVEE